MKVWSFLGIASNFTKGENFFIMINFVIYCQLSPQGPDLVKPFCSYSTLGMCLNLPRRNSPGHRTKTKYFPKLRVKSSANILVYPAPSWFVTFNFCQDTGKGTMTNTFRKNYCFPSISLCFAMKAALLLFAFTNSTPLH